MRGERRAVFLDRDGVLNRRPPEHQYVAAVGEFEWLPGAVAAVAEFARAGYLPVVVSNQRGLARGLVTPTALAEIEDMIQRELRVFGAEIASFYYCPHDTDEGCQCRKPEPGLLLRAAAVHRLDLRASLMIGDTEADIEAGRRAGCRTILLAPPGTESSADLVVRNLAAASESLVGADHSAP